MLIKINHSDIYTKGILSMDKDPLYKLYELYREAIIEKARKESERYYLAQIEQLTEQKNKLLLEHNRLTTLLEENRKLLTQNNITY